MKKARVVNALTFAFICSAAFAACSGGGSTAVPTAPTNSVAAGAPAAHNASAPAATPTPQGSANAGCSPSPTPSPTPRPTPFQLTLKPNSLQFEAVGDAYMQSVTIEEPGYTGKYTLDYSSCALSGRTKYVLEAVSLTGNLSNQNPVFQVFPLNAGSCTVVVRDDIGTIALLPVTISITAPKPTPTPTPPH